MPFKQCFLFFLVTTLTKRDNIVMGYLSKPHDFTGTTCDWMDWIFCIKNVLISYVGGMYLPI